MALLAIGFVLGALSTLGVMVLLSIIGSGVRAATSDDYQGD